MNIDLTGKRALVCGASQGIGKAIAFELASLGAEVTVCGRNQQVLEQVMQQLPVSQGQKHSVLVADFSLPDQLKSAVILHLQTHGPVNILINNTGGPPPGPVHLADTTAFIAAFQQHLICNQILVQALLPGMMETQYGRIINIISTSVKQPIANLGVSNTIRGAVANWAKTLAGELGKFGITVNNVLPGSTDTARLNAIIDIKAAKGGKSRDVVVEEEKAIVPLGRFAQPEEIAYAVAFLASPSAAYISGINLPVDGGRTGCL
ncbi:MAG: SDR family oxidoreductase [Planctomycetia bacterium]|nr:SDR family oxidoreductase [Planctomycetia bacterium]